MMDNYAITVGSRRDSPDDKGLLALATASSKGPQS